jgi:preprotein translocase subunit SecE
MATKAITVNGGERPAKRQGDNSVSKFGENAAGMWNDFTRFLSDVRAEMRKVVTPSRKEVESTTTVVLIAVFIFGVYFFVIDNVFKYGLDQLLKRLGGLQQ